MAGYWPRVFFGEFMDLNSVMFLNTLRKNLANILLPYRRFVILVIRPQRMIFFLENTALALMVEVLAFIWRKILNSKIAPIWFFKTINMRSLYL